MLFLRKLDSIAKSVGALCPEVLVSLLIRVSVFLIFWKAAQSKISGMEVLGQNFAFWNVTDSTIMLFEYEYALPLIPAEVAAYMATFSEFFLSLFILLGFMTRLSALGLLIMTAVIQLLVYFPFEYWQTHLLWAGMLLFLLKYGAGSISLDKTIRV